MQERASQAAHQLIVLKRIILGLLLVAGFHPAARADLSQTIEKIRPSVVGVGTYAKTRSPAVSVRGTGFAVNREIDGWCDRDRYTANHLCGDYVESQ